LGTASHFRNGLRSASEQLFFGFRVAGGLAGAEGLSTQVIENIDNKMVDRL
jgi:hypothetical protein